MKSEDETEVRHLPNEISSKPKMIITKSVSTEQAKSKECSDRKQKSSLMNFHRVVVYLHSFAHLTGSACVVE